jgi:hypothetical protein
MVIRAARNEAEAAQLIVCPAHPLKVFHAEAGSLAGPGIHVLPWNSVEILRVRYVTVTRPTDSVGVAAPWPDPLPPFAGPMDLEAGMNQPLWVRIKVPRDTPAGTYTGVIHLAADNYQADASLRLEVHDFDLPDQMTCKTAFGFDLGNVFRYQRVSDPGEQRVVLEKYWADYSAHHITPYDPAPLDSFVVQWPEGNGSLTVDPATLVPKIDWSAWDKAMERAFEDYHFGSFRLSVPGMGGGTFHSRHEPSLLGYSEDTPQYKAAFHNYCQAVESHLRAKGWLDKAYVYWFDEPDPKDYEFVMNGFRKLKESAPDIPRMLTEEVEPALIGGPDIWCPISDQYDHSAAEERRKEGDKFWWYVCTGPKEPYCTLFIDHPATDLRVWLWQTWQRKIDGILVWQSTYWNSESAYPDPAHPQNPYDDPMGWMHGYDTPKGERRPWGNGDGRFVYPPEAAVDASQTSPVLDGPVDSIRWEMLRDGIEDYEYCAMLQRLLAAKKEKLKGGSKDYESLLEVPPAITRNVTDFTTDPSPIEKHREAVAKAIEQLRKL